MTNDHGSVYRSYFERSPSFVVKKLRFLDVKMYGLFVVLMWIIVFVSTATATKLQQIKYIVSHFSTGNLGF